MASLLAEESTLLHGPHQRGCGCPPGWSWTFLGGGGEWAVKSHSGSASGRARSSHKWVCLPDKVRTHVLSPVARRETPHLPSQPPLPQTDDPGLQTAEAGATRGRERLSPLECPVEKPRGCMGSSGVPLRLAFGGGPARQPPGHLLSEPQFPFLSPRGV